MIIKNSTINFLKDLAQHNNREWFQDHKNEYQNALQDFKALTEQITNRLNEFDQIEKTKVFRIYRDVRFSKDKTPYKTNFSASFSRLGKYRRGGFFLSISPTESFVAGGFWNPNKDDLKYIRDGIAEDIVPLKNSIESEAFVARFDKLIGEKVKTSPRGYNKNHPHIDYLRYKQFLMKHTYPLSQVLDKAFTDEVTQDFKTMLPTFDAIRDYLIFDGNGVER